MHAGKSLNSEKTYYWKVRLWDQDNRFTEYSNTYEIVIIPSQSK